MRFSFHNLDDQEFEDLVAQICMETLGMGTVVFTKGRDGGRDGRFTGTANNFPSEKSPVKGKFIIQAKHTENPYDSCSDSSFDTIIKKELSRIENLASEKELEYYLLFTNRRLTGGADKKILTKIKTIEGVKDAWLLAKNNLEGFLTKFRDIWVDLGYNRYNNPLRIHPEDIGEVITAFHDAKNGIKSDFDSKKDFKHPGIKKKNEMNNLTCDYYDEIISDSVKHFPEIQKFLENPRNAQFNGQYHSTADEIKSKLMQYRNNFDTFDEVLNHLYDLIIDGNPDLKHRRRLANIFLHYMYCNCDIGKNA
jgi:hypothetical protein